MSHPAARVRASAPGSFMFFGEHAVLRGYPCLVAAVQHRIRVEVTPSQGSYRILSELGSWQGTPESLPTEGPLAFASAALREAMMVGLPPVDLSIEAGFRSTVGLGSSAAVVVAILAASFQMANNTLSLTDVMVRARNVIRKVQGAGSGADVAASVFGGLVCYHQEVCHVPEILPPPPNVVLIYSGAKLPTPKVIQQVNEWEQRHPERAVEIWTAMAQCTKEAAQAAKISDWKTVGTQMNIHQELQAELGLMNPALNRICEGLAEAPGLLGRKISGSGLGDCMLALGIEEAGLPGFEDIPVNVSPEGVTLESF